MPERAPIVPRKLAKQERSRHTVEALLQATARVLSREGYDRASTNRIAEVAGVNIGSLYQYFPNKDALVAALIDRHLEELGRVMGDSMTMLLALPLEQAMSEVVRGYLRVHEVDPALHRVLLEQVPRVERFNPMVRLKQAIVDVTRGFLAARRGELAIEDVDLTAFVLVQALDGLICAAVLERPELLREPRYADELTKLALRYVGVARAPVRAPRAAAGSRARRAGSGPTRPRPSRQPSAGPRRSRAR